MIPELAAKLDGLGSLCPVFLNWKNGIRMVVSDSRVALCP